MTLGQSHDCPSSNESTVKKLCKCIIWPHHPSQNNHDKTKPIERCIQIIPDSKVHGANMGPILGGQDPGGPHVGPMNVAIWVWAVLYKLALICWSKFRFQYTWSQFIPRDRWVFPPFFKTTTSLLHSLNGGKIPVVRAIWRDRKID